MAIYDIDGNVLSSGDGEITIESYFESEMNTTIESVRSLMTEPCLVFPIITDIHYLSENFLRDQTESSPTLFLKSIQNIRYFAKRVRCDFLTNLGDNTDGDKIASETTALAEQMLGQFKSVGLPYYQAIGNHDDNRYKSGNLFSTEQLFRGYMANTQKVYYDSFGGTNFYADFEEFKIRMIWLNCNNNGAYGISNNAATWFTETAMNTPNGYSVLVFGHLAPVASLNAGSQSLTNGSAVATALANYSGDVIAYIYGHNHGDCYSENNGIHYATFFSNKFLEGTRTGQYPTGTVFPHRKLGTASEDCWTVAVVRPKSKKINFVRFGAGDDYEISY